MEADALDRTPSDDDREASPERPAKGNGRTRSHDEIKREWESRRGKFDEEVQVHTSKLMRRWWKAAGFVALGLGIIGIFLPIAPTVPFAVLAAACFARSSPRFYNKVLSNKHFGPAVFEWNHQKTIHVKAKIFAILVIIVSFSVSIAFFVPDVIPKIIMGSAGLAVIIWLLTVPTTH